MKVTANKNLVAKILVLVAILMLVSGFFIYFLTLKGVDQKYKNQQTKGGSVSISIEGLKEYFISLQQGTGSPQTGNINITGDIQASGKVQGSSVTTDSLNVGSLNGILRADQGVVSGGATTSDVSEGTTNKYYTDERVDNRLSSITTNNITEGTTNQYYTDTRARGAIFGSSSINYNSTTGSISLPDSGVSVGTYGDGTHTGQFTVDAQGRVTSAAAVLITGAAPTGAAGGDLTGDYPNPTIKNTWAGVTGISTVGTITTGIWNAGAVTSSGAIQATSLNVGSGAISGGTVNGATISGGTLSGGSVQGGTLTALAVNGVTTADILVSTGSYSDPSWLSVSKNKVGLGNVDNESLLGWTGSSNVATLGTIGTGVWNGTAIQDAYIASATNWNKYNQWDGGSTGLTAATGRASLELGTLAQENAASWGGSTSINTLGTIGTGVWNAGAVTSSGALQGTSLVTPSITSSGAISITPTAGSGLNVNLSGTGDLAVNSNQLYVDSSTSNIGIGTATPSEKVTVTGGTILQTISTNPTIVGYIGATAIASVAVTAGGSGYSASTPPTVTITGNGGSGTGATAVATVSPTTGAITGVTVTNGGTGYTTPVSVAFSSGSAAATASLIDTKLTAADGLYISDKYAYIAAGGDNRVTILDISKPSAPVFVSSIKDNTYLNGAYGISVSGKYAYIAAGYGGDNRFTILDVSNPYAPTIAGTIKDNTYLGGALHIYVSGKYAYISCPSVNRVTVVDISNPTTPFVKSSIQDNTKLYAADGITVSGKYIYVVSHQDAAHGYTTAYLNAIDITDPSTLAISGSLESPYLLAADQFNISGKYAYIPGLDADTLSIVDVSDPTSMKMVGHITDHTQLYGPDYVYTSGKYAYVSAWRGNRSTIVDISDPTNPVVVGSLQDNTRLNAPCFTIVSGKYAYVTAMGPPNGFAVIDTTGMDVPSATIGNLSVGAAQVTENIEIGNNAYVRSGLNVGSGGVLSNGEVTSPGLNVMGKMASTYTSIDGCPSCDPTSTFTQGDYVYVVNRVYDLLLIYSATNSSYVGSVSIGKTGTITSFSNPGGGYTTVNSVNSLANGDIVNISGNASYNGTYTVSSVSGTSYRIVKTYVASGTGAWAADSNPTSVFVQGKYAYVANNANGFEVFDVSNPASPTKAGNAGFSFGSLASSIYVQGRYAYWANKAFDYFLVYDVSNPSSISFVGSVSVGTGTITSFSNPGGGYTTVNSVNSLSNGDTVTISGTTNYNGTYTVSSVSSGSYRIVKVYVASETGAWAADSNPTSVFVQGKYAYVANNANSFEVFDVSNPASPTKLGNTPYGGLLPTSVYTQGKYAYFVNQTYDYFLIYDISNPNSPTNVGSVPVADNGTITSFSNPGGGVYTVVNSVNSLSNGDIVNISNTTNYNGTYTVSSVSSGSYRIVKVYVASETGAWVADSNPTSVFVQGKYAYITTSTGLKIIDVSNPNNPTRIEGSTIGANATSVFVQGRYAWAVANGASGQLYKFDIGGAFIQQLSVGGIEASTLHVQQDVKIDNNANIIGNLSVGDGLGINGNVGIILSNTANTATATAVRTGNTVTSVTVNTGGSGYVKAPNVFFKGGAGTGAAAHAVLTGGVVTSIVVDAVGSGYTSTPTVYIEGGKGISYNGDLLVDVSKVAGTMKIIVPLADTTDVTPNVHNTVFGSGAYRDNVSGYYNTAVGTDAMMMNTTGYYNTAFGACAGDHIQGGYSNTSVGMGALSGPLTGASGSMNSAFGDNALVANSTGSGNTSVGYHSGAGNTTGANNTFLGYDAGNTSTNNLSNATAIGYEAQVTASSSLILGGTGANAVNVGIGTTAPVKTLEVSGDALFANRASVGTEKITNGTFTGNATGWTVGAAWAYSANTVVKNADGTSTLSQTSAGMATPLIAGETYVLSYTISAWTVGTITPTIAGVTLGAQGSNGTYSNTVIAASTADLVFTPSNTARFTVDNVTLKKITGGNVISLGNVGIGTSVPANQLNINAPITADSLGTAIITPSVATNKGLVVQGYTSQSADLIQGQSSAGAILFQVTSAGNLIAKSATFTGTLTVNGHIITANLSGTTTPSAGAQAGAGASVSLTGNDTAGSLAITTGTGATNGTLGTVTFGSAYGAAPYVVLTPSNADTTNLKYYVTSGTTTFTINLNGGVAEGTQYNWYYHVMQ